MHFTSTKSSPYIFLLLKQKYVKLALRHPHYCNVQGLDNDHGQTDSRARAQRLSTRAHQKVTWSMLIGVTNFHHQTKQRLPV